MKPNLFCHATPAGEDCHAVKLCVSQREKTLFNHIRKDQTLIVRDLITRGYFAVRWYPCGLGCYCAAQAKPVMSRKSRVKWPAIPNTEENES